MILIYFYLYGVTGIRFPTISMLQTYILFLPAVYYLPCKNVRSLTCLKFRRCLTSVNIGYLCSKNLFSCIHLYRMLLEEPIFDPALEAVSKAFHILLTIPEQPYFQENSTLSTWINMLPFPFASSTINSFLHCEDKLFVETFCADNWP